MASGKNKKVDIKNKPKLAVSGLAKPARQASGNKVTFYSGWKYPNKCFAETQSDRFQGVLIKWVLDYDDQDTAATNAKKKYTEKTKVKNKAGQEVTKTITKKVKTGSLSGVKKSEVYYRTKTGANATEAAIAFERSKYYPAGKTTLKTVKVFKVVSAKYDDAKKKWTITSGKYAKTMTLPDLNAAEKNGSVVSRNVLLKKAKTDKIKGKLYYMSKTKAKYTGTKKINAPKLYGVGITLQGWNSKSVSTNGKATTKNNVGWDAKVPSQAAYVSFAPPAPPKISRSVAGEASSHTLTFSVDASADDGTSVKERYDSKYTLQVEKGYYDSNRKWKHSKMSTISGFSNVAETKKTFNISRNPNSDMPDGRTLLSLDLNEYLRYHLTIYNRGFAGNGAKTEEGKEAGQTWFTYARPDTPSIKSVDETGNRCVIKFERISANYTRYTTKYTLQRLANYRPTGAGYDVPVDDWSTDQWREAAERDSGWTDVYSIGTGELRNNAAFFTDVAYAHRTDPFKRTYYRVKASNDIYGFDDEYSTAMVVPGFWEIPSAASQEAKILSVTSEQDGLALKAIVAFKKTKTPQGAVKSNGTELSWDTVTYAWQSTTPPSTYDFKDSIYNYYAVTNDAKAAHKVLAPVPVTTNKEWFYSTYYIRGVTQNEKYYIKARRFLKDTESRETESYGSYADYSIDGAVATVTATSLPKDVKLSVPERLIYGKDLSVTWTYDSDETQKSYELMWLQGTGDNAAANAKPLSTAEDSAPYCVVKWDLVKDKIFGASLTATEKSGLGNIYLAVRVTTDGGTSNLSEIKTVPVAIPPAGSISCSATLTAQPLVVTLGTNDPAASAIVRIVSNQVTDWGPFGADNQADGAIIHTTKFTPAWQQHIEDGKTWYFTNYSVPICDLRDNGSYTIEYTAVIDDTGLDSDTVNEQGEVVKQTATFSVNYEDVVTVPSFYAVADPLDIEHGGAVRISILDIAGNANCVADLYRVTPDGVHLLQGGIEDWRNSTIIDPFPPYSRHEPCTYRLALRSANGVREWDDCSYAIPGYSVRFDWGEKESEAEGVYTHLTLPYNLKWSDSWTKNSRVDLHLDGTYAGYWRQGVDHKNTLSTELVKLTGVEQVARVIALAKHSGPVLVRLPNGCEFAADVQVSNLDVSYDSLTVAASFSAQEIRMPAKFTSDAATVSRGLYVPQS